MPRRRWELRLSLAEREEISRGLAAGLSIRVIASGLGRSPSTVSREVLANGGRSPLSGGTGRCRGVGAGELVRSRRKLASRVALRDIVEAKLADRWSPQQIAGWLKVEYPDDAEMQVSHETIYRSLFVQTTRQPAKGTDHASAHQASDPPPRGRTILTDAACAPASSTSPNVQPRSPTAQCPDTGKAT